MADQLKQKMIGALAWSSIDRVAQQGVQFIIGIVLARLLSPSDYGLMGMVMIFTTLSYVLIESGFSSAIVRTKDITENHTNTVFYTNLSIASLLYLSIYLAAPYISIFFEQTQLTQLIRISSLTILLNSLYLVPFALIGKAMDYQKLTKINLTSTIISGLSGVISACAGFGVWALVIQQIAYHGVRAIAFFIWYRWIPQLKFSLTTLKEYASFSIHILGSNLLTIIFNNLYPLIIGKYYPIKQVGYYTQANKNSETINFLFQAILGSTTYNLFAQIHHQKERVVRILCRMIKQSTMITIPIISFAIIAAEPIFYALFGQKWIEAVPLFQLICAANLFTIVYIINNNALNSIGKSKTTFIIELLKKALIFVSIIACFNFETFSFEYSITTMLVGYIFANYIAILISMFYTKKHLQINLRTQISNLIDGILISASIIFICIIQAYFINGLILLLACQAISSFICYYLIIKLGFPEIYLSIRNFITANVLKKTPKNKLS